MTAPAPVVAEFRWSRRADRAEHLAQGWRYAGDDPGQHHLPHSRHHARLMVRPAPEEPER